MKNSVVVVILITLLSKLLGFGREIILSKYFGTSFVSDSYLIALTIPSVLWAVIGMGLVTAYIPIVSGLKIRTLDEINRYTSKFINVIVIFVVFMILLYGLFSHDFVSLFAYGFTKEQILLSVELTDVMIFSMLFTGVVSVLTGFLHDRGSFNYAAFISFPLNFCVIVSIILASNFSIHFLSYGFLFGTIIQLMFIFLVALKSGFRYSLSTNFYDDNINKTITLAFPVILGVSVNQLNVVFDKTIASTFSAGSISSLNYGFMITSVIHSIVVMSIVSIAFPAFSKLAQRKDLSLLMMLVSKVIKLVLIILVPITVFFIVYSDEIVRLVYHRGAFDEKSIAMTSSTLLFYSVGLIAIGFREVLIRIFYAFGDTKTPVYNSFLWVFSNIILSLVLSRFYDVGGLALASSVSAILSCALLSFHQKKKDFLLIKFKPTVIVFFNCVFISFICVFLFDFLRELLSGVIVNIDFVFLVSLLFTSCFYIVACFFLKVFNVDDLDLKSFQVSE
ncbi:TPA: murein biosynthesis integral membrane protein MurJ [Vibrio vulnificus]|uniref:murein biosynthesis integral membrane protein MurJ n=1 Tax=Vibrio vulnificus TaxID=672 RepID=UPI00102C62FF|nr:murein biosynthesis integral membrane protein MurJ [Vibrio vulnificus]RZQ96708.1 murein biosynthesis integral membrane protein MurJ [Vibrio vulnificus]HAS6085479.1 murein biosynthesis integral membrane protein MurJ [Vibrio vulnificus]HDY7530936.1 murein biosynthesis integral membrane protein MurJ [Vibrio vulnificus]HDY7916683.1 murein biosynthesis integral membrane protein MurJ [Vibrio vulnificus]